jgi:hypothetical protein
MLSTSWEQLVEQHTELEPVAESLSNALEAGRAPRITPPTLMSWLAAQTLAEAMCKEPKSGGSPPFDTSDVADAALRMIRFATTPERVYRMAFSLAQIEWKATEHENPWKAREEAVAALHSELLTDSVLQKARKGGLACAFKECAASPLPSLMGLTISSEPGRVVYAPAAEAIDDGDAGNLNGIVDAGEILDLVVPFRPAAPETWLVSESILPGAIPPCMVVPWRELVLPEVWGDSSDATPPKRRVLLPQILVSSRCKSREMLEIVTASSRAANLPSTKLEFRIASESVTLKGMPLEADMPGHSEVAEGLAALLPGKRIEARVVATASAGIKGLFASDAGPWSKAEADLFGLAAPGLAAMSPFRLEGSTWTSVDDLDLAPASRSRFDEVLAQRSRAIALLSDPTTAWMQIELVASAKIVTAGGTDGTAPAPIEHAGAGKRKGSAKKAKPSIPAKATPSAPSIPKEGAPTAADATVATQRSSEGSVEDDASDAPEFTLGRYAFTRYRPVPLGEPKTEGTK